MQCQNCTASIPPEWTAAIHSNICPACGKSIMNEASQTLLSEIRDAFTKMPNTPECLTAWLLENYNLSKVGSGEPTTFFEPRRQNKVFAEQLESGEEVPEKQNKPLTPFMKRTGIKPIKKSSLDLIAQKISSITEDSETLEESDSGLDFPDEDVMISPSDIEDPFMSDQNPLLSHPKFAVSEYKKENVKSSMASSGSVGLIKRSS